MKSVLVSLMFVVSATAAADAFSPYACNGEMMSDSRAVQLLGDATSVNLATKDTDPNYSEKVYGSYRWRNVVQGTAGTWNTTSTYSPIAPRLVNNKGALDFVVNVYDGYLTFEIKCALLKKQGKEKLTGASFTHVCKVPKAAKNEPQLRWGFVQFKANLTNSCLRLWSYENPKGMNQEWAYLLYY